MKSSVFSIDLVAKDSGENLPRDQTLDFYNKRESCDNDDTSSGNGIPSTTTGTSTSSRHIILNRSVSTRSHYSNTLSTGRTLIYLIKANLGPGLFAIPAAFKDAGLVGGSIATPIVALLSIHCMHLLVKCTKELKSRCGDPDMAMDYPQAIETACLTGSKKIGKCATTARRFIKVSVFFKELAFCSVFILFAGYYLRQLVSYYSPGHEWTIRHWTAIMSLPALVMACIQNEKFLHTLSYFASGIKAFSLIVLFVYIFKDDLPHVTERPAFSKPSYMLLFYGTAIFAFEGVTQALPLHDNMRTTQNFGGWNGVLNTGMVIISCLYFAVGFYGYLKYGDITYPSITMNLPKEDVICQVVKIGLIIALLINYGNQLHAAVEIPGPTIDRRYSNERSRMFAKVGIRATLFVSSVLVALITENLDLLMSLAGALTCTFVCLIFPPTLDIITFWHKSFGWFWLTKNIFIILMALVAFATGTLETVMAFEYYFDDNFLGDS